MYLKSFLYSFLIALASGLISGPIIIKGLKYLNFKQYVREDGPKKHLIKTGVPTMGGFIFVLSFIFSSLISVDIFKNSSLFIFASMLVYAFVGLVDDYGKVCKKQNEGLSIKGKGAFILISSLAIWFFFLRNFSVSVPLTDIKISFPLFTIVFIALLYSAVTNATNFTDGVDGLLTSSTIPIIILFMGLSYRAGALQLLALNSAFLGALLAYLYYNRYPAKVMMGDFGSLAIGGFIMANSIIFDVYWFIPIFGFWYVIEVVSVMIQIIYFKKTGKRFFKMAPYHHHLELKGFSENRVVAVATAVSSVGSLLTYAVLYMM